MYIKMSFFRKKIGTGVFCTTDIHVIVSLHMPYMYMYDAYSADLQTRQQFTLEVKRELTIHVYL